MQSFRLLRGDTVLGAVTLAPEERIDGGAPWDVGWLEPEDGFETVRRLFEQEHRLMDEAMELEYAANGETAQSASLLEKAADVQREIAMPGLCIIDLADNRRIVVDELHIEGNKVVWR